MIKLFFEECYENGKCGTAKTGKVYKTVCAFVFALLVTVFAGYLSVRNSWVRLELTIYSDEEKNLAKAEKGPLKGIYTAPVMKKNYEAVTADLDYIRSVCDGALYIDDLCPWYYMYGDFSVGPYTAYYVKADAVSRNIA